MRGSQPLIARRAIKGSSAKSSGCGPPRRNPKTVLRRNPTVETRSQSTPNNLSDAYFSVLLSSHSSRKINTIRGARVAHNPKVVGSNPTPATNQINNLQESQKSNRLPISPNKKSRCLGARQHRLEHHFNDLPIRFPFRRWHCLSGASTPAEPSSALRSRPATSGTCG